MLKRKLIRSGLFGYVVLLILAVAISSGKPILISGQSSRTDSTSQFLCFDPALLQLNGQNNMDLADAPVLALHQNAVKFVDSYIGRNNCRLQQIKDNHPRFFRIMDSVFTRYKLPVQLKYLAVVESELNTRAVSRVGAVGAWQLMPETARILSLKVNESTDERTHFYKSTVAAAKYLRDLNRLFDDWLLALAAYNAGPAPVYAAIKKSGSRNFWNLQYHLPEETRNHVKKFISTHYYFEGKGGITTLSKTERQAYTQAMMAFVEKQNKLTTERMEKENNKPEQVSVDSKIAVVAPVLGAALTVIE